LGRTDEHRRDLVGVGEAQAARRAMFFQRGDKAFDRSAVSASAKGGPTPIAIRINAAVFG